MKKNQHKWPRKTMPGYSQFPGKITNMLRFRAVKGEIWVRGRIYLRDGSLRMDYKTNTDCDVDKDQKVNWSIITNSSYFNTPLEIQLYALFSGRESDMKYHRTSKQVQEKILILITASVI